MHNSKAFTLVELCVITAIIAILCGIAYPSYSHYLKISRRSDAHVSLLKVASLLDQYYLYNNKYVDINELPASENKNLIISDDRFYRITANITDETYLLVASTIGVQSSDTECAVITLSYDGKKDGTTSENCW
jgi:type IV pilus assembly protein PilE